MLTCSGASSQDLPANCTCPAAEPTWLHLVSQWLHKVLTIPCQQAELMLPLQLMSSASVCPLKTCSCLRQGEKVKGRVLIIADGATSKLATAMGYCTEAPKGVCSRAYVEGGTHNTEFDGEPHGGMQRYYSYS